MTALTRRGLILINAYSALPTALNQSQRLKDELAGLGIQADVVKNGAFPFLTDGNGKIRSQLADYDFCVYLDKDKYTSQLLEKLGLRLFNSHSAIRACDDKAVTHILLSQKNIPMPHTMYGLYATTQARPSIKNTLTACRASLAIR